MRKRLDRRAHGCIRRRFQRRRQLAVRRASVYLWGAGIKGETATGGEVDIGFDSLISNLNMAFMGAVEARKSEWSMLADVV